MGLYVTLAQANTWPIVRTPNWLNVAQQPFVRTATGRLPSDPNFVRSATGFNRIIRVLRELEDELARKWPAGEQSPDRPLYYFTVGGEVITNKNGREDGGRKQNVICIEAFLNIVECRN